MRKQFLAVILALSVLAVPSGLCEVTFDWWGMIVSAPLEGIVECGSPIFMVIEDDFIVNGLETNEYLDDEGEPEYEWYLNGSATPCKTGQAVMFSTGESFADVPAGDFTVSVSGSRTCKVGWTEELVVGKCTCGCNDITCDCQWGQPIGGGAKGNGCSCKCSQNKAGAKGEDNDAKRQGDYRSIVIPIYHFEDIATGIVALAQRAFLAAKVVIRQGGADITNLKELIGLVKARQTKIKMARGHVPKIYILVRQIL